MEQWKGTMEIMVNFWKGKRVFITGHTGFKGGWLSIILHKLGAKVTGYSLSIPTNPSFFETANVESILNHNIGDIRDYKALEKAIDQASPDIILHMAAQPLVRHSYSNPIETYSTNVMGTVNVLEIARTRKNIKATLVITTDKCYENKEHIYAYREKDRLGGFDPYSNSKACAELVVSCYLQSYFSTQETGSIASVRAGNVIGGGDFVQSRLVPDIIRNLSENKTPIIRSPNSIRPWQHVLEPLSGYMSAAEKIYDGTFNEDMSWNFGPDYAGEVSVQDVTNIICDLWQTNVKPNVVLDEASLHEAKLLALDSTKARKELNWSPKWNVEKALEKTVSWYKAYYNDGNVSEITNNQIEEYFNIKGK